MKHQTTHSATSLIVLFMIALGFMGFLVHGYNVSKHKELGDKIQALEAEVMHVGVFKTPLFDDDKTWRELTVKEYLIEVEQRSAKTWNLLLETRENLIR